MTRTITYAVDALADLEHIAAQTEARWSTAQARSYLADIGAAIGKAAANPYLGSDCSHVRAGYRKMRAGSHVIYYQVLADRINVVRVLHQSMDAEARLRD